MTYDRLELLSLPAQEKIALAEELWSSVEEELHVSKEEIEFAEERIKLHEAAPNEGLSVEAFKKYFADKYGF
ncbi:MAG: addiction module protein [Bacteroidota bacterium]